MSPTLKAALALVFVAVVGGILIQPILDAADTDVVAAPPAETSEPSERETEEPDTPESSPEPEPTPTSSPSGGLVTGPFRTQPLFDRYPSSCMRASSAQESLIAVIADDEVRFGTVEGPTDPGPPGHTTLGRVTNLQGFNGPGDLYAAGTKKRASIAPPEGSQGADGKTRLGEVGSIVWSPFSSCGVAVMRDGSLLVVPDDGAGRLVRDGVVRAAFSPDGRRLAVVLEEGETTSVWVADLTGTTMREVHRQRTGPRVSFKAWSPDGFTLYLTSGPDGGLRFVGFTKTSGPPLSGGIVAASVRGFEQCSGRLLGIVNGAVAEITRLGPDYLTEADAGFTAVSCSPNGAFMAALRDDDLLLLNGDGSPVRDLTTDSGFRDEFVDWGPSGAGLIFGRVPESGGEAQVWYIPEGGTARDTGLRYRPGPRAIDWAASPPTGLP